MHICIVICKLFSSINLSLPFQQVNFKQKGTVLYSLRVEDSKIGTYLESDFNKKLIILIKDARIQLKSPHMW